MSKSCSQSLLQRCGIQAPDLWSKNQAQEPLYSRLRVFAGRWAEHQFNTFAFLVERKRFFASSFSISLQIILFTPHPSVGVCCYWYICTDAKCSSALHVYMVPVHELCSQVLSLFSLTMTCRCRRSRGQRCRPVWTEASNNKQRIFKCCLPEAWTEAS